MDKVFHDSFFSGLSGLQLPIPKHKFPKPFEGATRLRYYSSFFNSIEINSSFYRIPKPETVERWSASVDDNFKFTFKLWKEITHTKEINVNESDIIKFLNAINSVANKKGCLLIQLPPKSAADSISGLEKLLNCIRETGGTDWKIAVEFRNRSWYIEDTYQLLKSFNSAIVIHDIPKSATPMISHTADFIYLRFHGPSGNYRDSYCEDFLEEYSGYTKEWLKEGKQAFVYFNNTMGDAFNNLRTFNNFLNGGQVDELTI